ncbi:MAG TPA: hypothetical protein VFK89_03340 [Actinomycetota bacterium]|nr:hypothetical protein [Actinomycetota bacterium]
MEADISGSQRKIIGTTIRPARAVHGSEGIAVRDGATLPFVVTRWWSAPAGYYPEQWFLVHPQTTEVLYERPAHTELIRGLQAITELTDTVDEPIPLSPGTYLLVFALAGLKGGEVEVTVAEAPVEETAA